MVRDLGCPIQDVTIMAEDKDYNAICEGAEKLMFFVELEDKE